MENRLFKTLRILVITIALVALVGFGLSWSQGSELGLPWQIETSFDTQPLLLNYFDIDGEVSGIYVDQLLALQRYFTSDIIYNTTVHHGLFWLFLISMVLITAFVSLLDRTSYLIAAGVICLMITQLQIEELGLWENYMPYILIGLFIVVSYYFQAFRTAAPWTIRLLVSTLAYGILVALFAYLSPAIEIPLVAISQGIFGPLMLSALFILFVAGENIFSLFKLATTAQPGKKGLIHFIILGIVYLLICFLLFKEKNEGLSFDLYILGPEFLMIFSILSAYLSFGLRHQELEGGNAMLLKTLLYPIGVALFLATYSFSVYTVNDSMKNALDWVILISHLTMGAAYFIYAILNFAPALLQEIRIWPAFYKGPRTAVLTIRLMGFALFIAGILYLEKKPYYQAEASQFNMLGDLAAHFDRPDVAKSYYEQAVFNDFYNFKANYSINQIAKKDFDQAEGRSRLENVFKRYGNPIARMALANEYSEEDRLYKTLVTLQGATIEERTNKLESNLGLAHYYYQNYDSAYIYFSAGQENVNLEAAKYLLNDRMENTAEALGTSTEIRVNQQALANLNNQTLPFKFEIDQDTLINRSDIFYLYNSALSRQPMDREALVQTLDMYINNPKNQLFTSFLLTAKAVVYYHDGKVNDAFNTLDLVINRASGTTGFETFLKGIWYFDQGQPELTVEYVNMAQQRGYQAAQVLEFVEAVQNISTYEQKADISSELTQAIRGFETDGNLTDLVAVAQLNAFDHEHTLEAIALLQQNEYSRDEIYDLLLEATRINPKNPDLLEAYIYQSERLNLSSFADTAMDKYSGMVTYEDYFRVAKALDEMRNTNSPLN